MDTRAILEDSFGRILEGVEMAVAGLDHDALTHRVDADANPIGWLVWHLTRVQDDHMSEIAGRDQAWVEEWAARFGMAPDPHNTGYGHTTDDVAMFEPGDTERLLEYYRTVHGRTLEYLSAIDAAELDRVIDTSWDPPVTVGVRIVSVIGDDVAHIGQALFVKGMLERLD